MCCMSWKQGNTMQGQGHLKIALSGKGSAETEEETQTVRRAGGNARQRARQEGRCLTPQSGLPDAWQF